MFKIRKREGEAGNPYMEGSEGSFWVSLVNFTVAKDGFSKPLFELRVHKSILYATWK